MHACIDLGSNSFHLLIADWEDGRIQIVERLSEKVQLGENLKTNGSISPAAFGRGQSCLQRFKLLMKQYPVKNYWALGTNTFRVANNVEEFVQAAKIIGIEISVISGIQEAVLIYAGVITALPLVDSRRLIIDIGGGSTEIIVGQKHDRLLTESLSIGSVSWRDKFFNNKENESGLLMKQMDLGVAAAKQLFDSISPGIDKANWSEAYASSGTVKMLALICEAHGYGEKQIQLAALYDLKSKIAQSIADGSDLSGLKERRRDLLLAGWCILVGLMESYKVAAIKFSATALREGMLDFMVKNEKTLQAMESSELPEVSFAKG
jgi:exopolyphosphatase / guanosine-5'-triphosphate,3'-diphosphate pyrophosphatase